MFLFKKVNIIKLGLIFLNPKRGKVKNYKYYLSKNIKT
jgi:hypothetical protein